MASASYDFIIAGGGTAGLVLAARLSEDPDVKVLVLEAGEDLTNDQRVLMPPMWHRLIHSSADWSYKTVPQEGLGGRVVGVPQGRLLGGSGAMNGLIYAPPSKAVVDGWASLGNPGWEWDSFVKSFEKTYSLGAAEEGKDGKGGLRLNQPDLTDSEWPQVWKETLGALGLETKGDLYGGEVHGHVETPDNVNPDTMQRSFAGNAYLGPARERENLTVIAQALVEKVLFGKSEDGEMIAQGVQYRKDEESVSATATKEVILSAGAIHSPKILELSGVGSAERLKNLGIDVQIDNPHVGENLQTHVMLTLAWEIVDGPWHMDNLSRQDPAALGAAMEAFGQKKGPLARSGTNASALLPLPGIETSSGKDDLEALLKAADAPWESSETPAFTEAYNKILRSMISSPTEPSGLYMSFPGYAAYNPDGTMGRPPGDGGHFTTALILAHPRSSGNVHISKNSAEEPDLLIDPRYLTNALDVEVLARHAAFLETIATTEPLASKLKADGQRYPEAAPSAGKLTDLDAAREFVKKTSVGAHHFVGSCAMMPKEMGGVVDHELRLHGCHNLRVVDASAIPLSPSTNPQSTIYGFAEHAASIIKSGLAKAA